MKLDLEVQGKTITVEVVGSGAGLAVRIDGQPRRAEASWIAARELSLLLDGRSWDLQLFPVGADALDVTIAGQVVRVGASAGASAQAVAGRHHSGGARLTAPMPGKVVAVLAQVGDEVEAGQGVIVVEAMKMENELQAPAKGRIKAVHAIPGQVVEGGVVLVEIE